MFEIKPIDDLKWDSELVTVFAEIWEEREHVSQVSGAPLNFHFDPGMFFVFSHLHSRGACPALKLSKENIWLMTFHEHEIWEHYKEDLRKLAEKSMTIGGRQFGRTAGKMWKPCLDEFDRLKPMCNQIGKYNG